MVDHLDAAITRDEAIARRVEAFNATYATPNQLAAYQLTMKDHRTVVGDWLVLPND